MEAENSDRMQRIFGAESATFGVPLAASFSVFQEGGVSADIAYPKHLAAVDGHLLHIEEGKACHLC